eukprot:scaffold7070_cov125-Isochrysis_galbana.AAC.2
MVATARSPRVRASSVLWAGCGPTRCATRWSPTMPDDLKLLHRTANILWRDTGSIQERDFL